MLYIVILSTDILESEEFNPPVDSFDQLMEPSTIPTIEETNAESAIGSTVSNLQSSRPLTNPPSRDQHPIQ